MLKLWFVYPKQWASALKTSGKDCQVRTMYTNAFVIIYVVYFIGDHRVKFHSG